MPTEDDLVVRLGDFGIGVGQCHLVVRILLVFLRRMCVKYVF